MKLKERQKEVTTNDKVWVMGILFNDSQLQDYIPDMLGKMRGGHFWPDLDVASSCKLAGFPSLFTKFIDKEVLVTLLEKWLREEMKASIDALTCNGPFELMGDSIPTTLHRLI
jgi:hypothetical protein